MNKIKILCICVIAFGVTLLLYACLFISPELVLYRWCIGLASAFIVLGFGYLIHILLTLYDITHKDSSGNVPITQPDSSIKERSGFLVCKIMNILLCIYLLILHKMNASAIIIILGSLLLILQFLLDLLIQVILSYLRKEKDT